MPVSISFKGGISALLATSGEVVDSIRKLYPDKFGDLCFTSEAGTPLDPNNLNVGHAKRSITLDLYGHAMPDQDNIIAGKVSTIHSL